MQRGDLLGALARGYCTPENANKEVDVVLCEAMADEVIAVSAAESDALGRAVELLQSAAPLLERVAVQARADAPAFEDVATSVRALLAELDGGQTG